MFKREAYPAIQAEKKATTQIFMFTFTHIQLTIGTKPTEAHRLLDLPILHRKHIWVSGVRISQGCSKIISRRGGLVQPEGFNLLSSDWVSFHLLFRIGCAPIVFSFHAFSLFFSAVSLDSFIYSLSLSTYLFLSSLF